MNFAIFVLLFLLNLRPLAGAVTSSPVVSSLLPSDAVSLLSFKSTADLDNKLLYSLTERYDYCQWRGVKCAHGRVVRLVLSGVGLRGSLLPDSLSRLDQLRGLNLENNTLSGPVPDLSSLFNLKSLSLSRNVFSGGFPLSVLALHRLTVLDLSYNNFSGPIPVRLNDLDRLVVLNLASNRFNGSVPPLNQSFLMTFNVSGNNLSGAVPATPTLSRFDISSFKLNPALCGEVINKACASRSPFFRSPSGTSSSQPPLGQSAQADSGGAVGLPPASSPSGKSKGSGLALGFTIGVAAIIAVGLCFVVFSLVIKKRRNEDVDAKDAGNDETKQKVQTAVQIESPDRPRLCPSEPKLETSWHAEPQKEKKSSKLQDEETQISRVPRSGNLIFCSGEASAYTMEQLMQASAELLGRGTMGTTYKAVLDNQLIVTVKRLDATKTAATSSEGFEKHMDMLGGLRHPNLVPLRAYYQANGEKLVIYDYQPNGSLFNLIHGSRSSRAKPLHWTSCLKIAEDVAQGLSYIQRASTVFHGNIKSTNVLLGCDFEACLTDYSLTLLSDSSIACEDPDSSACKAPESRKSIRKATPKSDVYSFGVLLFELLTGKHPSQHPFMSPQDMFNWVCATRDSDGSEDGNLRMLVEIACICRVASPEQRPEMWQVLKMVQEVKESVMVEEGFVR